MIYTPGFNLHDYPVGAMSTKLRESYCTKLYYAIGRFDVPTLCYDFYIIY